MGSCEADCRTKDAGWTNWAPSTPDMANAATNEKIFFMKSTTFRVGILFLSRREFFSALRSIH